MIINKYLLSQEADFDLEEIFEYTQAEFGLSQAVKYLNEIDDVFVKLIDSPQIGRTRNEIKNGLYSFPVGKHIVFYRILIGHINIVRVLHCVKDLTRNF